MEYNYRLFALTPVHVGNGDSYTKKEYYLVDRKDKNIKLINRINLDKYVKSLNEIEQQKFFYNIKNEKFTLSSKDENIKKSKIYSSIENTITEKNKLKHPTTINAAIKNNQFKAYIPGSSIKGSIKTAIIYNYLKKEKPVKKEDYENICNSKEIENIMKNIKISDSSIAINIYTIQPKPLTLKSKSDKRRNDDDKKQGMYNAIECVYKANLDINIKLDDMSIDYIKECLYHFNKDYIEHELDFYSKIGTNKSIINIYNLLKEKNTKESPLIRIGGSTGLLSTTIGLHMKLNNLNEYKKTYIKDSNKYDEEFPKIRKITPNNMPFGWCRLKSIE